MRSEGGVPKRGGVEEVPACQRGVLSARWARVVDSWERVGMMERFSKICREDGRTREMIYGEMVVKWIISQGIHMGNRSRDEHQTSLNPYHPIINTHPISPRYLVSLSPSNPPRSARNKPTRPPHLASLGSEFSLMTEYAQCVKMLGNGRLEAKCQDGETRLGQIRGQMRKKVCCSEHASEASGRG
jgi:hypothetical protein